MYSAAEEAPDPASTDVELIEAAREGDEAAQAELFRRHWNAAVRVAGQLIGPSEADDLASEAFTKVFALIAKGKGPVSSFRPYLIATIRTMRVDMIRRSREIPAGLGWEGILDERVEDESAERIDSALIATAFRTLPERWRKVLWLTAVEGEPLGVVAKDLDMNANSVAALSFRAREGLRRAFLAQHLRQGGGAEIHKEVADLPAFARGALSEAKADAVRRHLLVCSDCDAAFRELLVVDRNLRSVLGPALAGAVPVFASPKAGAAEVAGIQHAAVAVSSGGVPVWLKVIAILGFAVLAGGLPGQIDGAELAPQLGTPATVATAVAPPAPAPAPAPALAQGLGQSPGPPSVALGPSLLWVDASLGTPQARAVSSPRLSIVFPISGQPVALSLDITIWNAEDFVVDGESGAPWQCQPPVPTGESMVLSCVLPVQKEGTSQNLDLVLTGTGAGPVHGHAAVSVDGVPDPNPQNNTQEFSVVP